MKYRVSFDESSRFTAPLRTSRPGPELQIKLEPVLLHKIAADNRGALVTTARITLPPNQVAGIIPAQTLLKPIRQPEARLKLTGC